MGSRLRIATTLAIVCCGLLGAAPNTHADEPSDLEGVQPMSARARHYLDRGLDYYRERNYESAIRAFRHGYEVEPRAEFLFARAQAERLSGDCPSAIDAYRQFLAMDPPEKQANAARRAIERCLLALRGGSSDRLVTARARDAVGDAAAQLARSAQSNSATSAISVPVESSAPAPPGRDDLASPWYRDPVGASLLGLGVASTTVGAGFFALSVADSNAQGSTKNHGESQKLLKRAEQRRAVAWISASAGATLIASATVYYWLRDPPRRNHAIAIAPGAAAPGVYVIWAATY